MKRLLASRRQGKAKTPRTESAHSVPVVQDFGLSLLEDALVWHVDDIVNAKALSQDLCKLIAQQHQGDPRIGKTQVRLLVRHLRTQCAAGVKYIPLLCKDVEVASSGTLARALMQAVTRAPEKTEACRGKIALAPSVQNPIQVISPPMAEDAGKICFLMYSVLTSSECEKLIARCNDAGWHAAALEHAISSGDRSGEAVVDVKLRDSDRCILFDDHLANRIWERLQPHIPLDAFAPLRPVRISDCMRCLCYREGQAGFAKHRDGSSVVSNMIGRLTVQMYLNEDFEGGATRLCHIDDAKDAEAGIDVRPLTGMALVFDQSILHKGCPVMHGTKYTSRTEVMYAGDLSK